MALSSAAERVREQIDRELIETLRDAGEHIPSPERADFGAVFDRFGSAKVVLLGEATHGTSEFYRARAAITRRLIERHGFNIVAVEADWPDAAVLDRHVRQLSPEPAEQPPFARFPTWMWRNLEVKEFIDYLRLHNAAVRSEQQVEFRGLDVYSLRGSMAAVIDYLDRVDPERGAHCAGALWLLDAVAGRSRRLWSHGACGPRHLRGRGHRAIARTARPSPRLCSTRRR